MDDVLDVITLRSLSDVRPGDLLLDGDAVVGQVIAGRSDELRARLDGLPDHFARWAWTMDRLRTGTGTVPCLPRMAQVIREHGHGWARVPRFFEIVREVR